MEVRLITSNNLIQRTPLRGNVDEDNFLFIINDVQTMYLKPILGTKLYEKILTDYEANTLTGLYKEIYDNYLVSFLCHAVFADFVIIGAYRVENAGVFKHSPNNAENIDKDEIDYLAKTQRIKADVFSDALIDFLCAKSSEIPEYNSQDNSYDYKA